MAITRDSFRAYAPTTPSAWTGEDRSWAARLVDAVNTPRPFLAQGVYSAGSTIPNVAGADYLYIANSGGIVITNFANGVETQKLTLVFADANTSVDRTNCYLAAGSNFTSTAQDTLVLIKGPTFWHELSRSANA